MRRIEKVLVHLGDFVRKPIDPAEVYFLEAVGDQTLVRARGARPWRDVRSLESYSPASHPTASSVSTKTTPSTWTGF